MDFDRYIIKADVELFSDEYMSIIVYFDDTDEYKNYRPNDDIILRFNVRFEDHEFDYNPGIRNASVVGFNIEVGIMVQVVNCNNVVDHIVVNLSKDSIAKIEPFIAKVNLLNCN